MDKENKETMKVLLVNVGIFLGFALMAIAAEIRSYALTIIGAVIFNAAAVGIAYLLLEEAAEGG